MINLCLMPQRKYPRIEIEQKAFDALQIEAILQHKKIREIATEAILNHVSTEAKEVVDHQTIKPLDLKTESGEDIATDRPLDHQTDEPICGPSTDSEGSEPLSTDAKAILSYILEELKAGNEPRLPM